MGRRSLTIVKEDHNKLAGGVDVQRRSFLLILAALIATCPVWCVQVHADGQDTHAGARDEPDAGIPVPVNDDDCVCAGAIVAEECFVVIDVMCGGGFWQVMLDLVALDVGALLPLLQRAGFQSDGQAWLHLSSLCALALSQRYRC